MSSQDVLHNARHAETAGARGFVAATRPLYHPCPFCGGVIVGRRSEAQSAVRFECTACVAVIYFPPEPEAFTVQ